MDLELVYSVIFMSLLSESVCKTGCKFPHVQSDKTNAAFQNALARLEPLNGRRLNIPRDPTGKYSYDIGICTDAEPDDAEFKGAMAGAIQTEVPATATQQARHFILGRYSHSELLGGKDWVMLEYRDGLTYGHHCGGEPRRAVIMFSCNENIRTMSDLVARVVEENSNKTDGCYYLFEVEHNTFCSPDSRLNYGLSPGSIVIIVFVSVFAVYLFGGFLYRRFAIGAKGMDQFPNYGFWQDFGNLQADGCDFVCRRRHQAVRQYKGLGDDQLNEEDSKDDHLLPM